jgi:hypothetical protein
MHSFRLALILSLAVLLPALGPTLRAQSPITYYYGGDLVPSAGSYAGWFTTVGPGHPTGSYFGGTTWSSDGDVLTMTTQHPADFFGATSQGIWFGRTDSYGDPSSFNLGSAALGNNVTLRAALSPPPANGRSTGSTPTVTRLPCILSAPASATTPPPAAPSCRSPT